MTSSVLQAVRKFDKTNIILKVGAVLCMPLLCLGCVCVSLHEVIKPCKSLKKVVKQYGGSAAMNKLAQKVATERAIFRGATTFVNTTTNATIFPDLTIWDMILESDVRIGCICSNTSTHISRMCLDTNKRKEYVDQVWRAYQANGGNYHVIVYGLIEYLCQVYGAMPMCNIVEIYVNDFVNDTALRVECLAHKEQAGM